MAKVKEGGKTEEVRKPLTLQEERFCREMLRDGVKVRSYLRAFKEKDVTYGSASVMAARLLENVAIQDRIKELEKERNKRLELSTDKVLRRIENRASFNPQDCVDAEGNYLPLHQLDPDVAACIQSLEVEIIADKEGGQLGFVRKYKFHDSHKSDELIGRNLKLWKDVGSKDNPLVGEITKIERTVIRPAE